MATEGPSRRHRILAAMRRHRWLCIGLALLLIGVTVAAVPFSQRSSSSSFDLTYTLPGPPYAAASICVPSLARLTISWASNDTLPGFSFSVQPPDSSASVFTTAAGSATFASSGGSFFIAAMNYSSPKGIVHVVYNWVEQGSLYQVYAAPQPECQAL
jgi:hypothetical protein